MEWWARPTQRSHYSGTPSRQNTSLIFPLLLNSRFWNRILPIGFELQGSWPVHGQFGDSGRKLMFAVEHVFVIHDLASVGGHSTHGRYPACDRSALGFVVRLIFPNCLDQVIPLKLVWTLFRLRESPGHVRAGDVLALKDSAFTG